VPNQPAAPLNIIEVVDDFNHPFTGPVYPGGTGTCTSANGQFRADGEFPATRLR
jgi:hypothetical protein